MAPVLLVPGAESRRYLLGMFFVLVVVAIGIDALLVPLLRRGPQFVARQGFSMPNSKRVAALGAAALAIAFLALFSAQNLREVDRWGNNDSVRWFFNYEYIRAMRFLDEADVRQEIRLYSARHTFDSSMRRFLLPRVAGADGSGGFGEERGIPPIDEISGDTVFVFFDDFLPLAEDLEAQFPGSVKLGQVIENGTTLFTVYLVRDG